MYTYLTDIVIKIDLILLAAALILSAVIMMYAIVREARINQRNRHLREIQRHLLAMAGGDVALNEYTPQEFFSLARDKELEVPPALEQKIRDHFATGVNIEQIESAAMKTGNKWQRIEAIFNLGYVNSPDAAEILKTSLYSADEDVSYYSLRSLGQIKNSAAARILLEFLGSHAESGNNIAAALETFPPEVASELFQSLDSRHKPVRFWALKVIGKANFRENSGSIAKIVKLSKDPSPDVRAAACECLGGLAAAGIKEALIERLEDNFWFVRMHAVRALDNVMGPLSLPVVAKLIKDPSWKVKESVKNIMAQNITEALPYIEESLARGNELTCRACADALVDSNYVLIILKQLINGHVELKEKAMRLLAGLISSKVYFGLKKALETFKPGEQDRLLQIITALDQDTAKRITGETV